MSDEIRNEEMEVTMEVETEDVKEGLSAMEYGVIGVIAVAGITAWEGGKLVWRKTVKPRAKVKEFVTGIFNKEKKSKNKDVPEHEGSMEVVAEASEEKKSESKKNSKK